MPANTTAVNLFGDDALDNSPIGRITTWAITYGRYIMIGTEIVVLLAFISRFSLDRKLTDLKEEIAQKQAILEANQAFEQNIRQLQERLTKVNALTTTQSGPYDLLLQIQSYIPQDMYLEGFDMTQDKVSIQAVSSTVESFSQFLINIQTNKRLTNLEIGDVKKQPLKGIQFKLTATLANTQKKP